MTDYFRSLGQSCKELSRNPVLFLPYLLQMLALMLLVLIFIGIAAVIGLTAHAAGLTLTPPAIVALVLGAAFALLLILVINAWFTAGSLAMVNDVTEGRKTGSASFFKAAKRKVWTFLGLQVLSALLFLVAALPLAIFILLAILSPAIRVAAIILAILFGILFLVAAFFLGAGLLFAQPALLREELSAPGAIAKSFRLLKERTGHVLATFAIVLFGSLLVGMAVAALFIPVSLWAQMAPQNAGAQLLNGLATILRVILNLVIGIIAALYTFRMYLEGWPATKRNG